MEGSHPALPAQPGTHTCSLAIMPGIEKITEQETAHPSLHQLSQLTGAAATAAAGLADNITVSHEIEERAVATLIEEDEEEDDEEGGVNIVATERKPEGAVDQGAFGAEPATSSAQPSSQAAVSCQGLTFVQSTCNDV